ncbi:hypothetical protein [Listeria seeligeri]|uniref:hypothetical protein n=1 Tax=Listeria seeligeri TaxID=1640 RepID=UPI00162A993F|nr:hypothetical protein [Listeria seeligeri]MBC1723767.1 hypothetical protein [Listeria seeligeri]
MADIEHKGVLIFTLIYTIVTTIFLINLNQLNKILLDGGYAEHAFALLKFNDYQPLEYFFVTMILSIAGGILTYFLYGSIFRCDETSPLEFLVLIICFMLVIVFIILLIYFIQNPIFQAILTVLCLGGIGVTALNSR